MPSPLPGDLLRAPLQASFHASYQRLVQFLTRKTGSAEDARELTQDLWLQLQRRAPPAAENPEAYLFTMARNLALDHLRRRQLVAEHGAAWRALHPEEPQDTDAPLLLAQRRVLEGVAARLQALPLRTREVFVQHRVHGLGHEDLAAQHGVTRSTIERDVQRGTQAVQAVLDDWHGPAGRTPAGRRRLMGSLLGLAGLATLAGGGTLGWAWWRAQAARWQATLASAVGRQLQQTLPDGSRITLDAGSQARLAYDSVRRHVLLAQGAAFFDVVHDADRPFVVQARHLRVTVLGTRFAVDIREGGPGGTEVEVGVESGLVRVEVDGPWPALELRPGDTVRQLPGHAPVLQAGQSHVAAWRAGWLGFREAPLGQVVQRLRRYTGQAIVVTPRAAWLPVTAEIRIAQAGGWLQALPRALPLRVERGDSGWTIALRDEP